MPKEEFVERYKDALYEPVFNALNEYFEDNNQPNADSITIAIKNEIKNWYSGSYDSLMAPKPDDRPFEMLSSSDKEWAMSVLVRRHIIEYLIETKDREKYLSEEVTKWENDIL
jgi:hypothetical protein|tara:strand:- start:98 stop:436 length:339 start_codon:yes stop_codon:yes gene_type:complete